MKNFEKFSKVFKETQFHLLFPPSVPLIPLKDMFVEYDSKSENPFILNILMDTAEKDLFDILEEGNYKPMNL